MHRVRRTLEHLLQRIAAARQVLDLRQPVPGKNHHQPWKTGEERDLQSQLSRDPLNRIRHRRPKRVVNCASHFGRLKLPSIRRGEGIPELVIEIVAGSDSIGGSCARATSCSASWKAAW